MRLNPSRASVKSLLRLSRDKKMVSIIYNIIFHSHIGGHTNSAFLGGFQKTEYFSHFYLKKLTSSQPRFDLVPFVEHYYL